MESIKLKQTTDQLNIDFKHLIKDKMNNDLKARYSMILAEEFQIKKEDAFITKSKTNSTIKPTKTYWIIISTILAITSIVMLLISSKFNPPASVDTKEMVFQYMAENKMSAINNSRSLINETITLKVDAYQAFENKDFHKAIQTLNKVAVKNAEDHFFIALSFLQLNDTKNAIDAFKFCSSQINEGDPYFHESRLYLVLSYVLNDNYILANQLYSGLEKDSWEYKQLLSIMKTIST